MGSNYQIPLSINDQYRLRKLKNDLVKVDDRLRSVDISTAGVGSISDDIPVHFDLVDPADIYINTAVQREVQKGHLTRIIKKYNPALIGAIVLVRQPDGTLTSCDGQHRALAAHAVGQKIPAVIYDVINKHGEIDWDLEARVFEGINQNSKRLDKLDLHRVQLRLGLDAACLVQTIADDVGFVFKKPGTRGIGDYEVTRIELFYRGIEIDKTGNLFKECLSLIIKYFPDGGEKPHLALHLARFAKRNPVGKGWEWQDLIDYLVNYANQHEITTSSGLYETILNEAEIKFCGKKRNFETYWGVSYFAYALDPNRTKGLEPSFQVTLREMNKEETKQVKADAVLERLAQAISSKGTGALDRLLEALEND